MQRLTADSFSASELSATSAAPSSLNLELASVLAGVTDSRDARGDSSEVTRFVKSYRYPVSPWPVFVDADTIRREIEPLVQTMPRLCYRALFTRFRRDPGGLESYFGWPRHLLDLLMSMRFDPNDIMARYDVFMGAEGAQLLEVNCGSSIGGWELDWIAPKMSLALAKLGIGRERELGYRNIFENMLRHMFDMLVRRNAPAVAGNLLIYLGPIYEGDAKTDFFACLLEADRKVRPPPYANGRLIICTRLGRIAFGGGEVRHDGERVDAILISFPPEENFREFYAGVTAATLAGKLVAVDSDLHRIIGDKRMLALLHECSRDGLLSANEAALVRRYIPWSRRVVDGIDDWRGETATLSQLLYRYRTSFVLKGATSYGGKKVVIGRLETDQTWATAVDVAMKDGDWIVQEYTAPGRQLAYAPGEGFLAHDLVWGLFGFGSNYGGAFVRASLSVKRSGVINSANGALEFVVIEDTPRPSEAGVEVAAFLQNPKPRTFEHELSPLNCRLLDALEVGPELCSERIDPNDERMPPFLRGWQVKVNAWPLIVDKNFAERRFTTALKEVPRVLYQCMQAYFGTDSRAFHQYFGLPPSVYELLRRRPVDLRDFNARYDLSVDADNTRILEINAGSAAGGFQTDWFQPFSDETLRRHATTAGWKLQRQSIFRALLESLIESMLRRKSGRARGHMLFYSFVSDPAAQQNLRASLQKVYDSVKPPQLSEGRIHLFTNFSQITLDAVGEVRFGDATMDAVLFTFPEDVAVPTGLYLRISDASLRGRVVFPDAPACTVLGSKMQFALAYECLERGLLDTRDTEIVREALPWSAMLREREIEWRGERWSLGALLARKRECFVLKKAVSFGGRDVYVGRYCTDGQWASMLTEHMGDRNWLAQEYCAPGLVRMYDPAAGICPHEVVWGLFNFGCRYGGTFLRAKPTVHTNGVINAANGAAEMLMYEQMD